MGRVPVRHRFFGRPVIFRMQDRGLFPECAFRQQRFHRNIAILDDIRNSSPAKERMVNWSKGEPRILEKVPSFPRGKGRPQCLDLPRPHIVFPKMAERLNHEGRFVSSPAITFGQLMPTFLRLLDRSMIGEQKTNSQAIALTRHAETRRSIRHACSS